MLYVFFSTSAFPETCVLPLVMLSIAQSSWLIQSKIGHFHLWNNVYRIFIDFHNAFCKYLLRKILTWSTVWTFIGQPVLWFSPLLCSTIKSFQARSITSGLQNNNIDYSAKDAHFVISLITRVKHEFMVAIVYILLGNKSTWIQYFWHQTKHPINQAWAKLVGKGAGEQT